VNRICAPLYYARDTHLYHRRRFRSDRQHAPVRASRRRRRKSQARRAKSLANAPRVSNYVALDRLRHLRGPGESYSDVILRLAEIT
jgi:hypothetical protein